VGSAARPWQSINTALARSEPGNTVHLLPGTYYEKVIVTVSGEEGAPITIAGEEGAVIDGSQEVPGDGVGYWGGLVELKGVTHVVVTGVTVQNAKGSAFFARSNDAGEACGSIEFSKNSTDGSNGSGIAVWECTGLTVRDNRITNAPGAGSGAGIQLVDVVDFQVSGNSVTKIGSDDVVEDGLSMARATSTGSVTGNTISDISDRGIVVEPWEGAEIFDVTINGNTVTEAQEGIVLNVSENGTIKTIKVDANTVTGGEQGLAVVSENGASLSGAAFTNNVVSGFSDLGFAVAAQQQSAPIRLEASLVNNTFYGNSSGTPQVAGGLLDGPMPTDAEVRVENNIFAGLSRYSVVIGDVVPAGAGTIDTNLFTEAAFGKSGETQGDNALVTSDPGFTDAASGDFSLAATSPAIDAGKGEGAAGVDCLGIVRPQGGGYDIGAYERAP